LSNQAAALSNQILAEKLSDSIQKLADSSLKGKRASVSEMESVKQRIDFASPSKKHKVMPTFIPPTPVQVSQKLL
jgi:hypothetical protein